MKEIRRIISAFGYARAGLASTCTHPAFRTELLVSIVMIPLGLYVRSSGVERALLIGSILLVLIVELLNTGIETAIDRISPEWHILSKKAKDVGAAAVLLSIVNAVAVWLCILTGEG